MIRYLHFALALLLVGGLSPAQESALQAAVRLTGEARFAEAVEVARAGDDPLQRAQGELYVLHRAGALEEALAAGLRGLDEAPDDAWTLEHTAYVALSLGAGDLAVRLDWMRVEATRLAGQRRREQDAQRRARIAALLGLGLGLLAFGVGLRPLPPGA